MRFYLNVPLVAGYLSMAIIACLGMLQLAAARGGYGGLSLFTTQRQRGARIGAALIIGALLAYVLFAPETLTPGPAGTEVAEMFALSALVALGITLVGADLRLQRAGKWKSRDAEPISLGTQSFSLYYPHPGPGDQPSTREERIPALALLLDPSGFVVAPPILVRELCDAGIAVLILEAQDVKWSEASLSRRTLLGHISAALAQLAQQAGVDHARIGLLGLGLGGDAVLRAAATDPELKAAVAVSPVMHVAPDPSQRPSGLWWLHELSYRQVWNWRRRWPQIKHASANLVTLEPRQSAAQASTAVLLTCSLSLAMRTIRGAERLEAEGQHHFRLLENKRARHLLVGWLQEKLSTDE